MNNKLTIFDFEDNAVRVIDRDGAPWFVASDVCRVLELTNPTEAVRGLDEDETITLSNAEGNPRAGIPHQLRLISESGLYALIFKSRKEEAKKFRKWITSEVIPAIRQTGSYIPTDTAAYEPLSGLRDHLDFQAESVSDTMREIMSYARNGSFPMERARVICALGGRALEAMRFRLELHNLGATKNLPAS